MIDAILRTLRRAACVALVGLPAACSPPDTDIVATVSEDVGPFEVTGARADGTTLRAFVCLERPGEAEAISDRVLLQLRSKGYHRIELDLVAADGRARRATWTPDGGKQMQEGTPGAGNPCAPAGGAHE